MTDSIQHGAASVAEAADSETRLHTPPFFHYPGDGQIWRTSPLTGLPENAVGLYPTDHVRHLLRREGASIAFKACHALCEATKAADGGFVAPPAIAPAVRMAAEAVLHKAVIVVAPAPAKVDWEEVKQRLEFIDSDVHRSPSRRDAQLELIRELLESRGALAPAGT